MANKSWTVLSETIAFDERYLRVKTQRVRLPSGIEIDDYHLIESRSWAATIAVTPRRELVLVEQYRHGHGESSLELPAGVIEEGEDPMTAALRELQEETGYAGTNIQALWSTRPEPARHRQWAHIGFAANVEDTGMRSLDATEDLQVVLRPVQQLPAIIESMVHAVHIGALLLAERRGLLVP